MTPKVSRGVVVGFQNDRATGASVVDERSSGRGVCLGRLVAFDGDRQPLVEFPENPTFAPAKSRTCVELDERDLCAEVALGFERGDLGRPLILGRVVAPADGEASDRLEVEMDLQDLAAGSSPEDLRLIAARSVTIRCGKSSITLHRDGRVLISGTYVETRSSGTNRIQGGSVRIN
jgi:hypothetical protein